VLETPIQGLVVHGAAHLSGKAAAVWDIVPDADHIVVVIESIGHRVQELLGLFSPNPVQVLQARIDGSTTRTGSHLGA